jgi:hypothetical protein
MNVPTRMLLWCEKPLCRDFRKGHERRFWSIARHVGFTLQSWR